MSQSYFQSKDSWRTRAIEVVLFSLAGFFRVLTWPLPARMLGGLAHRLGGWAIMVVPRSRQRALDNLALVWPQMPEAERRAIARDAAGSFARMAVEYARLERFSRQVDLSVEGIEHLKDAAAAGKGAILVTAHYGNWEAARLAAKRAGCETGIIYRAFNNRPLDRWTMRRIPKLGAPVLQKGAGGMRKLVNYVRRGGFIMILVDQRNSGAPFLDFLGHPAETVTVAADLAAKTGAALIPTRGTRGLAGNRFDVSFEAPIKGDDPIEMMQQVNDRISAWITEYPGQWLWFHRRWRSTTRSRARPGED